jgi:hypothetical protein
MIVGIPGKQDEKLHVNSSLSRGGVKQCTKIHGMFFT